jgi:hypothetical protein
MFGLRKNDKDTLTRLLKQRTDFEFDKSGIKNRLLASIENQRLNSGYEKLYSTSVRRWNIALGGCMAVILLPLWPMQTMLNPVIGFIF